MLLSTVQHIQNVNGCEKDEKAAFRINAIGARNLSIASQEMGQSCFRFPRTMFFRNTDQPYRNFDAPDPKECIRKDKAAG